MSIVDLGVEFWKKNQLKIDENRMSRQTPPGGVTAICDLSYIGDGKDVHKLDIYYLEQNNHSLPVILDIHGGAWAYGFKELNKNFCMYLASNGFAVVNINYELLPDCTNRGQIEDIFYAVKWLTKHCDEYFLDLKNVFIVGDSAGGQLALLSTAICLSEKLQKIYRLTPPDIQIKAIGSICSAHDLSLYFSRSFPLSGELMRYFFGADYKNSPYIYCSSIKDVIREVKLPPVFMTSSDDDFLRKQSVLLDALLTRHGVRHVYRYLPKREGRKLEHVFNVLYPEWDESIAVNDEMLDFFREFIN